MLVGNLRTNKVNKISLKPSVFEIGEVEVAAKKKRKLTSVKIIRKAIQNIKANYPIEPFNYVAYYRDFQQKEDVEYFNLNEAILEVVDPGFNNSPDNINFKLLKYKENEGFQRKDVSGRYFNGDTLYYNNRVIPGAVLKSQGGNELFILMSHDAIRRNKVFSFSFIDILTKDILWNHNFDNFNIVSNDGRQLYQIDFYSTRVKSDTVETRGSIFIEPGSFAINKLDYSGYYIGDSIEPNSMFNVLVEYGRISEIDEKLYLKYISFNNLFYAGVNEGNNSFKVENTNLSVDGNSATLTFTMNSVVDHLSAGEKSNYEIKFGCRTARIKGIMVQGKRIFVKLKNNSQNYNNGKFLISNIKDIDGRIVNRKEKERVYQFRELFVHEYNSKVQTESNCYLQNRPLSENCTNKLISKDKYWMNSPLAEEEK